MQPAKRVVAAAVAVAIAVAVAAATSKESGVAAARLWTALAVAIAVYIRFWLDLCHLINQTNTPENEQKSARKEKGR